MKLYKLFKDIFGELMYQNGFIHQSDVFMRIIGDNIMQAITVKPIINYEITCHIFPLFDAEYKIKKGYIKGNPHWAENVKMTFDGYRDFPHVSSLQIPNGPTYYMPSPFLQEPEYIEMTRQNLQKACEMMESDYMPIFDKVVDFPSFIQWKITSNQESLMRDYDSISPEALGCKAYYDRNFDFVKWYLEEHRKDFQKSHLETHPTVPLEDALNEYDNRIMWNYKIVYEWMRTNDLSWVPSYIADETEKVKQLFLSRYSKLKVFFI